MPREPHLSPAELGWRWLVGMGLISWRYLWATTPLHRTERRGDGRPPPLPEEAATYELQPWASGVGPLYHRTFRVRIDGAHKDAATLMDTVIGDMGRLVPREVVQVHEGAAHGRRLRVGERIVVDMPGPWNGPVRVVAVEDRRLQLATLVGHLEAGQIEFRARGEADQLVFEVEAWARAATRTVDLLYSHLKLAKEIQLNMWVRFCLAAAVDAGGRVAGGVEVCTEVIDVG